MIIFTSVFVHWDNIRLVLKYQ